MPANYHPLGFDFKADIHNFLESPYARVPKELGCALTASLAVSPLVSIIDKAMIQDISSIRSLTASMFEASKELVTKPRLFLGGLAFRLTFAVYFGTYAVANLSEAALDFQKVQDEQSRKFTKVGAASAANVSLLAWRDSIFARTFSSSAASANKTTPLRTIGLFGTRDTVTMAATFWAAPKVCEYVVEEYHWDEDKAEILCAFGIPVLSQFLTAPLHIHAIDYYNRPSGQATTAERVLRIREEMGKVCLMRGLRILPAFGIGSYSNNKLREWFIRQDDEELLLSRQLTVQMTVIRNNTVRVYRQMTSAGVPPPESSSEQEQQEQATPPQPPQAQDNITPEKN